MWLPSGGSLVIDRTEAMTVVDVNTGKFVGSGGNLEETVTKNNLEAAEEIVRQLRLRDIGGIIVVDFIDMVLESNRDLVLRRLVECLSRDRTKHQVAEVTSLGLVQMTRKKLGLGLLESFSEPCEVCAGRGIIVHHEPIVKHRRPAAGRARRSRSRPWRQRQRRQRQAPTAPPAEPKAHTGTHAITEDVKHALAQIAASTIPHTEHKPAEADAAEPAAATVDRAAEASVPAGDAAPSTPARSPRAPRRRPRPVGVVAVATAASRRSRAPPRCRRLLRPSSGRPTHVTSRRRMPRHPTRRPRAARGPAARRPHRASSHGAPRRGRGAPRLGARRPARAEEGRRGPHRAAVGCRPPR